MGIPLPGVTESIIDDSSTFTLAKYDLDGDNSITAGTINTFQAETTKPMECIPCVPDNIDGFSPTIILEPQAASEVIQAANNAIASSGLNRLTQPGQPFNWAANRFDGASAGNPIPVYTYVYDNRYCSPCNRTEVLSYYYVPYLKGAQEVGKVKVNPDLSVKIITVSIPKASTMASNTEFLTTDKIRERFPDAVKITPFWKDNDITGIQTFFFWEIQFVDGCSKILSPYGEEMIENRINGKLYRRNVDLGKPSEDIAVIPDGYNLHQNYPNPFNATTQISFELPNASNVKLEIYNVLGQKVITLIDERMDVGHNTVTWDGSNFDGEKVSSGIYFYRFQAGSYVESRKLHFLK